MISEFISKMCIPIQKTYSRRNYFKAKNKQSKLEKMQFQSKKYFQNYQNQQFCDLIKHCYENVPYYKKIMKENGLRTIDFETINDVVKLPLLTKQIVTENFDSLISKNAGELNIITTGGTSGKPICIARGKKEEYLVDANNWRMWNYAGYELGMPLALFWGNELELKNEKTLYYKLKNWIENTMAFNCFDLTEERIINFSKNLNNLKPLFIRGYASAIYQYSRYCLRNGIASSFIPDGIILTSEKVYKDEKEIISEYFKCPIYEEYGCREFSIMAHECKMHAGLHVAEDMFLVEVIDNEGRSTFTGTGEIVVTSLQNRDFPLIRYCLGDEVTLSDGKCGCGIQFKTITELKGRINDYVISKANRLIHGEIFAHFLCECKSIMHYQVRQTEKGSVQLDVVRNTNYNQYEINCLLENLSKTLYDLEITTSFVENINLSRSGKRRSVVTNLNRIEEVNERVYG